MLQVIFGILMLISILTGNLGLALIFVIILLVIGINEHKQMPPEERSKTIKANVKNQLPKMILRTFFRW
jgi:predicted lipid-binding transport protein (Tim44 family)